MNKIQDFFIQHIDIFFNMFLWVIIIYCICTFIFCIYALDFALKEHKKVKAQRKEIECNIAEINLSQLKKRQPHIVIDDSIFEDEEDEV